MTKSTNTPSKAASRSKGKQPPRSKVADQLANAQPNTPEPVQKTEEPKPKAKTKGTAPKSTAKRKPNENQLSPTVQEGMELRQKQEASAPIPQEPKLPAAAGKSSKATNKKGAKKSASNTSNNPQDTPKTDPFQPATPAKQEVLKSDLRKQVPPPQPQTPTRPPEGGTARPAPLPAIAANKGIISRPQGTPPNNGGTNRPENSSPQQPSRNNGGNNNPPKQQARAPQHRNDPRPPAFSPPAPQPNWPQQSTRQGQNNPPSTARQEPRPETPASPEKEINIRLDQSVAILIDGNNIEMSLHSVSKNTSSMINFDKLVPYLLGNRALSRLIYFREGKSISPKLAERLQKLFHGSVVPCHKSADIPLSIKAVQVASKVDTIIILSGDADYVELVRHLKHDGLRVEIAAFPETTADILRYESDYFFPITVEYSFALK